MEDPGPSSLGWHGRPVNLGELMIGRFQGTENRGTLVQALRSQQIVKNEQQVAERLADVSELLQYEAHTALIVQGAPDTHLLLVLVGRVSVTVNGREVAVREAGQHVGEMAMIDVSAPRSATVTALEPTVVAKIPERGFAFIANDHPSLWRQLALELASRLRQRNQFMRVPNPRPVVFFGSSSEGLAPLRELQSMFSHDDMIARSWPEGFRPSLTSIENLEREMAGADFAVLVLGPDDLVESRNAIQGAPRDNVIWEHGFFAGGLGRNRVFIVKPRGTLLKLPSDWGGITMLDFDPIGTPDDLASRLSLAAQGIRREVNRLNVK